jgi:hypothetical protein
MPVLDSYPIAEASRRRTQSSPGVPKRKLGSGSSAVSFPDFEAEAALVGTLAQAECLLNHPKPANDRSRRLLHVRESERVEARPARTAACAHKQSSSRPRWAVADECSRGRAKLWRALGPIGSTTAASHGSGRLTRPYRIGTRASLSGPDFAGRHETHGRGRSSERSTASGLSIPGRFQQCGHRGRECPFGDAEVGRASNRSAAHRPTEEAGQARAGLPLRPHRLLVSSSPLDKQACRRQTATCASQAETRCRCRCRSTSPCTAPSPGLPPPCVRRGPAPSAAGVGVDSKDE